MQDVQPSWKNLIFIAKEVILRLLDLVGLSDRANHKPAELSGGQRTGVINPYPQPLKSILKLYMWLFGTSPEEIGKISACYVTDNSLANNRLQIFYRKKEIKLGTSRLDPNLAQELWEKSLQLIHEAQTN